MIKAIRKCCVFSLPLILLLLLTVCSNNPDETELQDEAESVIPGYEDKTFYGQNYRKSATNLAEIASGKDAEDTPYERFKLVHISDAHLSGWSSDNNYKKPKNLIEAVRFVNEKGLRINAMVHTGDHISNSPASSKSEAVANLASFVNYFYRLNKIPSFISTGNHDTNTINTNPAQMITRAELHSLLFAKQNYSIQIEPERNYFYTDLPNPQGGSIRIISLDPTDQEGLEYDAQHWAIFTQEQIDWLCNKALKENMTTGHSVIVLLHYPLCADSAQPGARKYWNEFMHTWSMIPEIIEAFRSKTSRKYEYTNRFTKDPTKNIRVDVDFSQAPGEFICYLGGHIHTFDSYEVGDIRNANPTLPRQHMIISNNMSPSEIGTQFNTIARISNSTLSNSFNIYAIDTKEKKVYITFFGAYMPAIDPDFSAIQEFRYL